MQTYLIDGYNLLFKQSWGVKTIQRKREKLSFFLEEYLENFQGRFILIFDSSSENETSQFEYFEQFHTEYAPKGLSADDFILEKLSCVKHPKTYTVITSDRSLAFKAKNMGALVLSIHAFLQKLKDKKDSLHKKEQKREKESKKEIERLLSIFLKKLEDESES